MRIKINGSYFEHFTELTLSSSLDAVASTLAFTCRYDAANPQHRQLLQPLSYLPVTVEGDSGALLFTGSLLNHAFTSKAQPELLQVNGYSLGGILEDCCIPPKNYPLEAQNLSLIEICTKALAIFGLKLKVYPNVAQPCGLVYEKSVCGETDKVKEYLCKLAAQRNVLLSHDAAGNVILFRPNIAATSKGFYHATNTTEMTLSVNGQELHSELTILRQAQDDDNTIEGRSTLKNPLVKAYRPWVGTLSAGNQTDTLSAVKNAFAAELKNISVSFTVNGRWDNLNPGDIVELQNEDKGLPVRSRWMVTAVTRNQKADEKIMGVACVLPETFTGEQPKNIFG